MSDRINWNRTGVNKFQTANVQKTSFTGSITYSGSNYALTIAGPGAPAPSTHTTLRAAKKAFRKFLLSKPVR